MGLFHFGKKKEKELEKSAETVEYKRIADKVNIKEKSCTNDENRRFVMLIEEAFPAQGKDGIVTVGMMYGTIKNGDTVYLLEPGDQICMVNVIGLAVRDGGKMEPVEEAANRLTGVKIYDISGRNKVAKYSVLTSVKPQSNRKDPSSIENPYVWGLSSGYQKFIKDTDYFNILISELLMTNVLVPMYKEEEGYAALSRTDSSGKADLLVFTDKYQMLLGDWKKAIEREGDLQITAMRFTDCIEMICSQNKKKAGIAVNAYGGFSLLLSEKMLYMIYQSGEFQRIIKEQK